MSEPKVDQPAAEREPDNVTPLDPWVAARDEAEKMAAAEADAYYTALEQQYTALEQQRTAQAEPERRTVSLELATDELRELAVRLARSNIREEMAAAKVVVVLRFGGDAVAVPDTDVPWATGAAGDPVKALRGLLSEMIRGKNQLERDEGIPVEMLMPSAAVLAALDGRPDAQLLTAPVYVLALDVEAGMLLADFGDALLQRVDRVGKCEKPDCDEGASCVVLTFDGGEQHQSGYARTRVRIPVGVTK